eukprot:gene8197-9043_t
MIQSCFFETPIAGSYLRNNRSTRQKSLRCFPACDPRGHIAAGFCGLPLRVRIRLTASEDDESELNIHSYLFIAETRPANTPGISSRSIVSKQSIMQNIRTKSDKASEKGELFIGDVAVISSEKKSLDLLITFNAQHCSWDYSWKSNRWSGSQEHHVVDIIVLKYSTLSDFVVTSSFPSTPFIVASSHKRAHRSENSDAEVLQASNLLTTLCVPVDPRMVAASGNNIIIHDAHRIGHMLPLMDSSDGSASSCSDEGKTRKSGVTESDNSRTASSSSRRICGTLPFPQGPVVLPTFIHQNMVLPGNQGQVIIDNNRLHHVIGRGEHLIEGAETLISLLSPASVPIHDHAQDIPPNKRLKSNDMSDFTLSYGSGSLNGSSDGGGLPTSITNGLVLLPSRE